MLSYIHPHHKGKGLGVLALRELAEARRRGIRKLPADISSEDEGNIRLRHTHGFVAYGRRFGMVYLAKELERCRGGSGLQPLR